jgi:hypothetical protein
MIKYLKVYMAFLVLASIILFTLKIFRFTNMPGPASEDVMHHVIVLLDQSGSINKPHSRFQEMQELGLTMRSENYEI